MRGIYHIYKENAIFFQCPLDLLRIDDMVEGAEGPLIRAPASGGESDIKETPGLRDEN